MSSPGSGLPTGSVCQLQMFTTPHQLDAAVSGKLTWSVRLLPLFVVRYFALTIDVFVSGGSCCDDIDHDAHGRGLRGRVQPCVCSLGPTGRR
jgi:hypothetical protein